MTQEDKANIIREDDLKNVTGGVDDDRQKWVCHVCDKVFYVHDEYIQHMRYICGTPKLNNHGPVDLHEPPSEINPTLPQE